MGNFAKLGVLISFISTCMVVEANSVYNVLDYGASGDSKTEDTHAFLKAWKAACADRKSPTLLIPSGKTFLLNIITFQGPCRSRIHVQFKGNIIAPNKLWANSHTHLIMFQDINDLAVDGSGLIDGQGAIWWDCMAKKKCGELPYLFGIMGCNGVRISSLNLINSPAKHLTVYTSTSVFINWLKITAPKSSPNTDGILIARSQNVEVTDLIIGTGDDCIAIGPGSSEVNVARIQCGPGHGISVGSLGGNNSRATAEKIRVTNCSFSDTMFGARIKTWQGGSGYARNISYENLSFNNVQQPIHIDQYYCGGKQDCKNSTSAVQVSDVSFEDARGTTSSDVPIKLACSETVACKGILLRDIEIKPAEVRRPQSHQSSYCLNAFGTKSGVIIPEVTCLH